jgi:hypothetical protein
VDLKTSFFNFGGTGGLVGFNSGGIVTGSNSEANIFAIHGTATGTSSSKNAGGLVGLNRTNGIVENSFATGDVLNEWRMAGGLVGWNFRGKCGYHEQLRCLPRGYWWIGWLDESVYSKISLSIKKQAKIEKNHYVGEDYK